MLTVIISLRKFCKYFCRFMNCGGGHKIKQSWHHVSFISNLLIFTNTEIIYYYFWSNVYKKQRCLTYRQQVKDAQRAVCGPRVIHRSAEHAFNGATNCHQYQHLTSHLYTRLSDLLPPIHLDYMLLDYERNQGRKDPEPNPPRAVRNVYGWYVHVAERKRRQGQVNGTSLKECKEMYEAFRDRCSRRCVTGWEGE